jgi:aconitate decarboxylase
MGVTAQLAATICAVDFRALPAPVVIRTVQAIADGVAVAIAGCDQTPVTKMARHVRDLGARPVSSVWCLGFRTSPVQAAYVNGMAVHVLDFEPMWSPPTHAVSPTVPVAFALAEARGCDGRDVIAAVAKGMEVQSRLLLAADQFEPERLRFHPPGVAGVIGATVTAAHMLALDELQLRHAIGIAASRCGTILANVGTMTKAAHCGGAAAAGLESALLAAAGFRANPDVIEAAKGLASTYFPDAFDAAQLLGYGRPWRIVDPGLAIKLYPSQYATHFAIAAALDLRRQAGSPEELARVRITAPVMKYVDRPRPATGLDGKFSLQYTAAVALLDGQVTIDSFTDERRARPDVESMLERITLTQDDSIPGDWRRMRIEIDAERSDGRCHRAVSHGPNGCWGQPQVTADDLRSKLLDCFGRQFSPAESAHLISALHDLENAGAAQLAAIVAFLSKRRISVARR